MHSTAEKLLYIYIKHIKKIYANSDISMKYKVKSYWNSQEYTDSVLLCNCEVKDLQYLTLNEQIKIYELNLQLSEREKNIYESCMLLSYYDHSLAIDLFTYNLYLNEQDKNVLRNNILDTYQGWISIFLNKDLLHKLQLTHNERMKLFNIALFKDRNILSLLTDYYKELTEKLKNRILQVLLINTYEAMDCLLINKIPVEFQLRILNFVFTVDNYYDIFNKLCNKHIDNEIRTITFNYIIQNPNCMFSYFDQCLTLLTINELNAVYNKFHEEIFKNTSSFNDYFHYCKIFGKFVQKNERLILIKKLQARTRANKIQNAMRHINFDSDELDILNALMLKNKLL